MNRRAVAFAAATLGNSVLLRRAWLRDARWANVLRQRLTSGWLALALLYLFSALVIALHHVLLAPVSVRMHPPLAAIARWFFGGKAGPWLQSLALMALILAANAAQRARKRIVILTFANLTGDEKRKTLADSLPRRLMTQLSEIAEVYSDVSEDPADLTLDKVAETPALAVDGEMSALAGLTASFKDQKVSFGFLSIPLGGIFSTLSTFMQGPRIVGSIQETASGLHIEASISGGEYQQTWRVKQSGIEGVTDPAATVDAMIRQLAYQVFTCLEQDALGTSAWCAAEHYTEAMRAFREANREKAGTSRRILALQRAQKEFFLAYREDGRFTRSRYNLGVMNYFDKQYRAAYEIFRAVIDDPGRTVAPGRPWSPRFQRARQDLASIHYAAAKAAQGSGKELSERVRHHCDMAIALAPAHSQAWNLIGVILEKSDNTARSPWFRQAVALSWSALCESERAGKRSTVELARASIPLANLAESYSGLPRSVGYMKQSAALDPSNAGIRAQLGRICLAARRQRQALDAFETANRIRQCALHWLWIACTARLLKLNERAEQAWKRACEDFGDDFFQGRNAEDFWRSFEMVARIPSDSKEFDAWKKQTLDIVRKVAEITDAENGLATRAKSVSEAIAVVEPGKDVAWLADNRDENSGARLILPMVVKQILDGLADDTQPEKLNPDNFGAAPALVVRALEARPTRALERSLMARLYLVLKLPELAEGEMRNALILDPADPDLRALYATAALGMYKTVTDKEVRRQSLRRTVGVFRDLAAAGDGRLRAEDNVRMDGWAHFNLAKFSYELLDYNTAQKSFQTAAACRYKPLESLASLSLVHFRCGAAEEGEEAYQRLKLLAAETNTATVASAKPEDAFDEDKPPAFLVALSATHTAGAKAALGLTRPAYARWKEGRKLQRSLPAGGSKTSLISVQIYCLGLIRLSAAASAQQKTKKLILRQAIRLFTRTLERAEDPTNRAEAFYQISVACDSLSRADAPNAHSWRARGLDALQKAENADRRGEYEKAIEKLRAVMAAAKDS